MEKIRRANLDDSRVIYQLSRHLGYKSVSGEIATARLKNLLESAADKIWVLERDDIPHGWIHVFIAHRVASPSFVEIAGLVVSSQRRRSGIDGALVNHAKYWANEKNLGIRVRCNTTRVQTQKFYHAMGFTNTKAQNVYETAYVRGDASRRSKTT